MKRFAIVFIMILLVCGTVFSQDIDEVRKKIAEAANKANWEQFIAGIKELGSINTLESAKTILKMCFALDGYSVSDTVKADTFEAGKYALKQIDDREAVSYMREQLLKNRTWQIRRLLAEVLGSAGGEENRIALCGLLEKERQPEVIREAVKALVAIGDFESVDTLIELLQKLEDEKGLPWVEVRKALTTLTGADYATAQKWREYWRVRKDELKANPDSPDTAAPGPGEMSTGLDEEIKKAPKFFGREILSKRFCFIIDVSGSMAQNDKYSGSGESGNKPVESTRIEMVKDQLVKLIASLDPKTKFNIVAYSLGVTPWQKQKLVPANSSNKKAAIEFVKKFRPHGTTHTDKAIKEAFANKEADTIVLLSDGAPTHDGRYQDTPGLIQDIFGFVKNANRSRKVTIDTFGFESVSTLPAGQQCLDFLKRLAEENKGKFTPIK